MSEIHKPGPAYLSSDLFRTGDPPIATEALGISDQARELLNWEKNGQIFSYLGQGPFEPGLVPDYSPYRHLNPDVDYAGSTTPYLAIITKSEDLSYYHPIGIMINAWRYAAGAEIHWRYDGGASWERVFKAYHSEPSFTPHFTDIGGPSIRLSLLCPQGSGPRDYGQSGGGYGYHKMRYSGICIGGVAAWTMPDTRYSMGDPVWTLFQDAEFGFRRQVRGEDTTRRGLGNLIGDIEAIRYRTSRSLLHSGHPLGISTSSNDPVDIRTGRLASGGDSSKFNIQPVAPYRGNTVLTTPCVVAWAPGASEGSPATVRFSSVGAGDTCSIDITSGTEALYTSPGGLEVLRGEDRIVIDFAAHSGGAVAVRSYALWED